MTFGEEHPLYVEGFRNGVIWSQQFVGSLKDELVKLIMYPHKAGSKSGSTYWKGFYDGAFSVYSIECWKPEGAK